MCGYIDKNYKVSYNISMKTKGADYETGKFDGRNKSIQD